jgi:RimJ/RimL family protein N-acetyltransferase
VHGDLAGRPARRAGPPRGDRLMRLPFEPALPVDTERLALRAFHPGDFPALFAFHSRPDVVRYVPFEPRTRDSMAAALERKLAGTELRADGDHLDLAVTLAGSGLLVGDVVLALTSTEHGTVEVGYIFDPNHAGQGYATEAVRALLDLAFRQLRAHRVYARVDARNTGSRALCERLGMRPEAHLIDNEWFKGEWSSEVDYALLDREWTSGGLSAKSGGG